MDESMDDNHNKCQLKDILDQIQTMSILNGSFPPCSFLAKMYLYRSIDRAPFILYTVASITIDDNHISPFLAPKERHKNSGKNIKMNERSYQRKAELKA